MEILIFIGVVVVVYIVWSIMNGNLSFWKFAAKYPDEVFVIMTEDELMWVIEAGEDNVWENKDKSDYTGPFRLFVPCLNSFVKIYGKADQIETEQKKIMEKVMPAK